jgi:soluble lytic murein transglycosylase-like protein
MPTVIDELVILLNLRTDGAADQLQEININVNNLRREAHDARGEFSALAKDIGEARNSLVLLFSAFTGGKGLVNFIKDGVNASANISQLSDNLRMSETALRQWKMSAEDANVSGDDMLQTLADMTAKSANFRMQGYQHSDLNTALGQQYFSQFGGDISRMNKGDPLEALYEEARLIKKAHEEGGVGAGQAFANELGKGNLYNLMKLGEDGIKAALEANKNNAELSKKDAEAARTAQQEMKNLAQELNKLQTTIITKLANPLTELATSATRILNAITGGGNDGSKPETSQFMKKYNPLHWMDDESNDDALAKAAKKYGFDAVAVKQAFVDASKEYGVPLDLLMHQSLVESIDFNPHAKSNRGARGLAQIMPETALGMKFGDDEKAIKKVIGGDKLRPFRTEDPLVAPWIQAKIMSENLRRHHGDEVLALAEYNAGIKNVGGYKDKKGNLVPEKFPPFKETRNYVRKIQENIGRPLVTGAKYRDIVNSGMPKPAGQQNKEGVQIHINKMDVNAKDATGADKFAQQILKNQTFTQMQTAVTQ